MNTSRLASITLGALLSVCPSHDAVTSDVGSEKVQPENTRGAVSVSIGSVSVSSVEGKRMPGIEVKGPEILHFRVLTCQALADDTNLCFIGDGISVEDGTTQKQEIVSYIVSYADSCAPDVNLVKQMIGTYCPGISPEIRERMASYSVNHIGDGVDLPEGQCQY